MDGAGGIIRTAKAGNHLFLDEGIVFTAFDAFRGHTRIVNTGRHDVDPDLPLPGEDAGGMNQCRFGRRINRAARKDADRLHGRNEHDCSVLIPGGGGEIPRQKDGSGELILMESMSWVSLAVSIGTLAGDPTRGTRPYKLPARFASSIKRLRTSVSRMSPTTTGATTPYFSAILPASASARSRLLRHPMIGMAPRPASASATEAPSPPDPPARITDFPFTSATTFGGSFDVNTADETRIDRLSGQWLEFLAQLFPPPAGKWF